MVGYSVGVVIVSPPQIVGTRVVAGVFGRTEWWVRQRLGVGCEIISSGYIGKIGNRHCWNATELFGEAFVTDERMQAWCAGIEGLPTGGTKCRVCGNRAGALELCPAHVRMFSRALDRASSSRVQLIQLIAMCRWIDARWGHVAISSEFDPWSPVCATPGCEGAANVGALGPLCTDCWPSFRAHLRVASV